MVHRPSRRSRSVPFSLSLPGLLIAGLIVVAGCGPGCGSDGDPDEDGQATAGITESQDAPGDVVLVTAWGTGASPQDADRRLLSAAALHALGDLVEDVEAVSSHPDWPDVMQSYAHIQPNNRRVVETDDGLVRVDARVTVYRADLRRWLEGESLLTPTVPDAPPATVALIPRRALLDWPETLTPDQLAAESALMDTAAAVGEGGWYVPVAYTTARAGAIAFRDRAIEQRVAVDISDPAQPAVPADLMVMYRLPDDAQDGQLLAVLVGSAESVYEAAWEAGDDVEAVAHLFFEQAYAAWAHDYQDGWRMQLTVAQLPTESAMPLFQLLEDLPEVTVDPSSQGYSAQTFTARLRMGHTGDPEAMAATLANQLETAGFGFAEPPVVTRHWIAGRR